MRLEILVKPKIKLRFYKYELGLYWASYTGHISNVVYGFLIGYDNEG